MNDNETRIYKIHTARLDGARAKLDKLNTRAARLGCAPAVLTVTGYHDEPVYAQDIDGNAIFPRRQVGVTRYALVTVTGEAPKFAGWTLAACIENTDGGNIMRKSPDCKVELEPRFRTCASGCDHCNMPRNRKETFVVIHDSGAQKLVGRDCIRDFLGHDSPDNILARAEWAISLDGTLAEFEGDCGCGPDSTLASTDALLAYAACATRVYGFISGSRARAAELAGSNLESTGATAQRWMLPSPKGAGRKELAERQRPTEVDDARAAAARAFVLATLGTRADLSDFENNLLVACRADFVDRKNVGLLAFVVEYHARETEKSLAREREAKANAAATYFPAEPKTRVKNVKVKYLRSIGYESQWGAGYFHLFSTVEGGHTLKWSTGTAMYNVQPGTEYSVTFTVKSHDEFRGAKQTSVSRMTGV